MRNKIIFILALIIFAAAFTFEFVPMSSAKNGKIQGVSSAKRASTTKDSALRPTVAKIRWNTVVNNSFLIPGSTQTFSSYGQPAVNTQGVVVFRARSTGSSDRQSGMYMRESLMHPVQDVADLDHFVPFPNNLNTMFREFPSIPRISMNAVNIALTGNHSPVYSYLLPDGTETRVGTTGIYTRLSSDLLITGASKLGNIPGFEHFAVPGINPAISFDVFPGSPAINDEGTIAFKGNYTENGVGKTGVFFRRQLNTPGGGNSPIELIASSDMEIPNTPEDFRAWNFDSTAPPTIAGDEIVFVGLDYEDDPRHGGIFLSSVGRTPEMFSSGGHKPELKEMAGIGKRLAGASVPELTLIGEGLAFDGNYIAFWAAWGNETKTVRLYCPVDGNSDLIAYCNGVDPKSVFDEETGEWYQEKEIPVNQGIFVMDKNSGKSVLTANSTTDFNDFLFWVYSGKPPGTGGDEEAEPPRWRSSGFVSVSDGLVAFKARTGILNDKNVYVNPIDGIYMVDTQRGTPLQTVIETGMDGSIFDPMLQQGEMEIVGLGIEREGLRGRNLAITATMENAEESWGGIYVGDVVIRSPIINPIMPGVTKGNLTKSEKR